MMGVVGPFRDKNINILGAADGSLLFYIPLQHIGDVIPFKLQLYTYMCDIIIVPS